jgi:hypothetical protein
MSLIPSKPLPLLARVLMANSGYWLARIEIRNGSQSQGCLETK